MDPNMVRLEGVRMMEREAEAERKRLELVSPQEKPQEQPSVQVNNRWTRVFPNFLIPMLQGFIQDSIELQVLTTVRFPSACQKVL